MENKIHRFLKHQFSVNTKTRALAVFAGIGFSVSTVFAGAVPHTSYPSMMSAKHDEGYGIHPIFTVGETIHGYMPEGLLDGMAAFKKDDYTVRVLVNHELTPDKGYPYELVNGVKLTGARVSYFDIDATTRNIKDACSAYKRAYDRNRRLVKHPSQINESGSDTDGFARFCSGAGYAAGEYRFEDDIYFTCEETSADDGHPHGGSIWAIDVKKRNIHAVPVLGRGAWENVTALTTPDEDHIALLLGDDSESAPLYLWIGKKSDDGRFLFKNGLQQGTLYVWKSDTGELSPEDFHTTGSMLSGTFVKIKQRDTSKAGQPGYDENGYLDDTTLRSAADALGAFSFSRPEDLHTNPENGTQAAFASTGRGSLFPSDDWGTVYLVNIQFSYDAHAELIADASITILHDCDDYGDFGVRSPDNLTWASDGYIYVQEDKSTKTGVFGGDSGIEASIWRIDPNTSDFVRIAVMDRAVVAPAGSTDSDPSDIGDWESSGIIDVTKLFNTLEGETLFLFNVQAHSIRDGLIEENNLVQGGQLLFLNRWKDIKHE
ncbi:MAG: DUF839 domain-containing protein [Candidatus Brocadiaceae bacterium]|nr:DUF839 domain-containing protein [Candidatus Brocadiaceae bacterium]